MKTSTCFFVNTYGEKEKRKRRKRITSQWLFEVLPKENNYGKILVRSTPFDANGKTLLHDSAVTADLSAAKTSNISRLSDMWVTRYFGAIVSKKTRIDVV